MLIVGAGGLAAQIFPELVSANLPDIVFWSEREVKYSYIRERFPVISSDAEVRDYFEKVTRSFILCIGAEHRRKMAERFTALGGKISTYISPMSFVSPYCSLGAGTMVLSHVIIESGVQTGEGCLFNKTSNAGHDCVIGAYCEFAPGVMLMGGVEIGENSFIGPGSILLPRIKIGKNATIAAGSVMRKGAPDNALVAGSFASVVKVFKDRTSPTEPEMNPPVKESGT